MIKRVLLDAGPWFAFLSARDKHHAWAVAQFDRFAGFVTCEPVLTEVCHRLSYYQQDQDLAVKCVERGAVTLDFDVGESLIGVRSYLLKYADQGIDLADACLLAMAEIEPRCHLVTTDRIFEIARLADRKGVSAILPGATAE